MAVYIGISEKTGELVVGDMLVEITVTKEGKEQQLAILDFEDLQIHPVPACIKILSIGL